MKSSDLVVCRSKFDKRTNRILTSKMSARINQINSISSSYSEDLIQIKDFKRSKHRCVAMRVNKLSLTLRKAEIYKRLKVKMRRDRVENLMLEARARKRNVS